MTNKVVKNQEFFNNKEKDKMIDEVGDVAGKAAVRVISDLAKLFVPIAIGALGRQLKKNRKKKKKR